MTKPKLCFDLSAKREIVKLSHIASPNARIGWQNLRRSEFKDDGDVYIITGTDFESGLVNFKGCKFVDLDRYEMDPKIKIHENDILVTKDGTIGKVAIVKGLDKKATLNAGVFILNDIATSVDREYLYHYLRSPLLLKFIKSASTGGTILHLNQSVLLDFPISLPDLEEQQKIAAFFTALDEKIASVEKQSEQLIKIREKLFSIFADLPEIQSSPLKFLLELAVVGDVDHKMPKSVEEGIPYLMTGDLFSDTVDFDRVKKISPTDYDNLTNKIRPCRGDIVMARYASVGSVKFIEFDNKFVVSYSCAIIKCKSGVNSKFIYYSLASKYLQDQIKSFINSGTQANVGLASIKKLQIKVPNIKIQEEVANKLSDLDRYIKLKNERLNSLRVLKAAFMQQMFV